MFNWQRATRNHVMSSERRPMPGGREGMSAEVAGSADPVRVERGLSRLAEAVPGAMERLRQQRPLLRPP